MNVRKKKEHICWMHVYRHSVSEIVFSIATILFTNSDIQLNTMYVYIGLIGKIAYQSILKKYVKAITQLNAIRSIPAEFFLVCIL